MVEDSLGLVVWVILGTQHPKPALELINVESKILSLRMRNVNRLIRHIIMYGITLRCLIPPFSLMEVLP